MRETPITLGGVAKTLRYDLNAFAAAEAKGVNLWKPETLNWDSPAMIRTVLWAGLLHGDRTLTPEAVGSGFAIADLQDTVAAIGEALGVSMTPHLSEDRRPDPSAPEAVSP